MKLPTLDVPDDKAAALLEAFGDKQTYLRWLKAALKDEVRRRIGWKQVDDMVAEIAPEPDPEPAPEGLDPQHQARLDAALGG